MSNSITVHIYKGETLLGEKVLVRQAAETVASGERISTGTFENLPVGPVRLQASAYPGLLGAGTAQAEATRNIAILPEGTTEHRLDLNTTIQGFEVRPMGALLPGMRAELRADTANSLGVVDITIPPLEWTSSDPTVLTVEQVGQFGNINAIKPGEVTITARERETGLTSTIPVYVAEPAAARNVFTLERPIGQANFSLCRYGADGNRLFKTLIPDSAPHLHGMQVRADGSVLILGVPTGSIPLTTHLYTFDPTTGQQSSRQIPDARPNGTGFAIHGDTIIFPLTVYGGPGGLARYNLSTGQITPFAQPTEFRFVGMGKDGKLYAVKETYEQGTVIHIYNPDTLAEIGGLSLSRPLYAIAVNASGTIYGAEALSNRVVVYSPTGVQQAAHHKFRGGITTLQLDTQGRILAGSENISANSASIHVTDETFAHVRVDERHLGSVWVASDAPNI